jgi:UDP-N-acetylglucosamine 1-carboxyvinyltransferase
LEKFVIHGGKPLEGEVTISGAKNAAVAILPATILAADKCVIENLPCISDVMASLQILSELGASIRMISKSTYEIDTTHLDGTEVSNELSRQMRASYYFLGALLGRFGIGQVAMPGGCNLGPRPIDQHLKAFSSLGAEDSVEYGMIRVSAKHLCGAHVFFDTVSVGATMNAMLAATMTPGQTVLENVAKEPHVVDLANFLNMMGADVHGAGTDVIKIRGVKQLHGCNYSIIPDQIEAGSYMVAAAITKGNVLVHNIIPKHLEPITAKLRSAGCTVTEYDDSLRISRAGDLHSLKIKTMPHPGFPTDMQPLMTVLLSLAKGTSIVTEGIWENRFRYVDELLRMGANIQVDGQVAVIEGVKELHPAPLRALDLRAGAAMVVAALAVDGTSEIDETSYIERGYENIVEKLQALGADIRRVETPVSATITRAI